MALGCFQTVGGSWNKSLHLQPLQGCYCENSGSPVSAGVMQHRYSITYTQSLRAINGLLPVGRVGNLLCGRPSYLIIRIFHIKMTHSNIRINSNWIKIMYHIPNHIRRKSVVYQLCGRASCLIRIRCVTH